MDGWVHVRDAILLVGEIIHEHPVSLYRWLRITNAKLEHIPGFPDEVVGTQVRSAGWKYDDVTADRLCCEGTKRPAHVERMGERMDEARQWWTHRDLE